MDEEDEDESHSYIKQICSLKEFNITTVYVDWRHLMEKDEVLAQAIQGQYYR